MSRFCLAKVGVIVTAVTVLTSSAALADTNLQKATSVEGITEYRLENGARLLLFPDPSRPLVTVNMTVLVGSRHEGYGETGMAHLLEHMLFKGTPTFTNVPKSLRDHGARFNGTTWVDRTNYWEKMPASDENLEFGIKLEADRLVHSFVKREDLVSEMTVVRNEFEQLENNAEAILMQRINAAAFEWHNYGKSTIGNRTDIERVPIESLQRFYRKYYQPDNVVLIIAGQFDEKKAMQFVQKYWAGLPKPARHLDATYTEEPEQDGEHNVVLRRVGTVGAVGAAYHIAAGSHPDFPAIEVLANVLATEPAGRLYKALVETKKASKVYGGATAYHDPGLLEVGATCEPTKLDEARATLIATLEDLPKNPVTDEETNRAKVQLLQERERLVADSSDVAIRLSEWTACGDWRLFFLHRDRLEKVTTADVNRVAAQYFLASNRTVGVFIPTPKPQRSLIAAAPALTDQLKDYKGREAVKVGEAFDPSPANLDARTKKQSIEGIKVGLLPKKNRGETVTIELALRFGTAESLTGQRTNIELMAALLDRGTKKHNRQELTDALDKLGAQLSIQGEGGVLVATMQTKRKTLAESLDLLAEILREPVFPEKEFTLLKAEVHDELNKGRTEPTALAFLALEQKLAPYPKDDIRHVPSIDEELAELKAAELGQLKTLYAEQIGAQAGELAVVGDFDPAVVVPKFESMLHGWRAKVPYQRVPRPAHPEVKGSRENILTPDKKNALYIAGLSFAVGDNEPITPALEIGNYLFGGGPLTSRLANRVRQKEGLSYGVNAVYRASPRDKASRFMMYAICNPQNIDKLDKAMMEEMEKYLAEGPTPTELADGQKAYLKAHEVRRTDDGQLASTLLEALNTGRTFVFYGDQEKKAASLKPDEVKAAFREFIAPKKLIIIRAGDFKK